MTNLLVNYQAIRPVTMREIPHEVYWVSRGFELFERLIKDPPLTSRSHLQDHALRMLNNMKVIGQRNWDARLLQIAIILHDVGVFFSQEPCHGPISAEKVRPHLNELNLSLVEQDRVCSIIRSHDDKSFADNSPEAQALRALDSLDSFGAIGVYRFLEIYHRRGQAPKEMVLNIMTALMNRKNSLPDNMFNASDLGVIQREFDFAFAVFTAMEVEISQGIKGQNALEITRHFQRIDWDLKQVPDVLIGIDEKEHPYLHRYFTSLAQGLNC